MGEEALNSGSISHVEEKKSLVNLLLTAMLRSLVFTLQATHTHTQKKTIKANLQFRKNILVAIWSMDRRGRGGLYFEKPIKKLLQ